MAEGLLNHISHFSSISPKCEPAQRYYKHVLEILGLFKPVADEVLASGISLDENVRNIFEELDGHIKYTGELMEGWHQLSSRLYFALHFEYLITKLQACITETFQLLYPLFELLPEKSHAARLESCQQKVGEMVYESISDHIKQAISDQTKTLELDKGHVGKIVDSLNLFSNEELLIEVVALDKLKAKLSQVESPEDTEYVDPMISLINRMHDSYVRAHQLPSINGVQIPADFCCPLSLELMSDPVIVASGQTYERVFIRKWLDYGLTVCPKTGQSLSHTNLIPNYTVKALIANWCESNNIKLTLKQPSAFLAAADANPDDSCIPRFGGHPKSLMSRPQEPSRSAAADGSDSAVGEEDSAAEEPRSSSSSRAQLPSQAKTDGSDGRKEVNGGASSASSAVSSAEHGRGEEASEDAVVGETGGGKEGQEEASAAAGESQSGRASRPSRGGAAGNIWRRPADRLVARMVPSAGVESRAELSQVETEVRGLVENLQSESAEAQRAAAHELRLLAKHNMENRIVIASCGAIPRLVELLGSEDGATQENAVTALLNLSINDNNKMAIANADAIDPLIRVLETGSAEAKENSAATLFSLSVIEENKVRIGRSGAIEPLVALLGWGTPRGKRDAATALFNLSIFHENKARIVQAGAVRHLVDLMDPAAGMVDKAVAVLANLATIQEGRTAIGHEGGIPALVEVVELGSARGKENAAAALLHLCTSSSRFSTIVLQEGAVPPLVALSQSGTPRAKEKAQLLLTHFRNQRHSGGRS
ncbi:RING/U-box superfamily protein with ARM repeat domain-containing protein [Wolffia australiana]